MLFDKGAAKMAGLVLLMCDTSIEANWRELDPFLEIKNIAK